MAEGTVGFRFGGQGVITGASEFKPQDRPGMVYYTVRIGYVGGEIKCSCPVPLYGNVREGEEVDFIGRIFGNKGDNRCELVQVGPKGTIHRTKAA